MRRATLIAVASSVFAIAAAGCNNNPIAAHKLVTTGGQHTVPLYPDEATFLKISHNAQQGGVTGMVGNAQQDLTAKKIEDQTRVKVISSDNVGSEVEIVEGPMKGTAGFVANQNVD
jgi:transcription antitermination factor NusG